MSGQDDIDEDILEIEENEYMFGNTQHKAINRH